MAQYVGKNSLIVFFFLFLIFFSSTQRALADAQTQRIDADIAKASIEELLDLTVSSVSKVPETFRRAPAAITVLTAEDVRRSGVRSIPELLRLVPGVQVARVDANKWAVSIRGFNDRSANKLLVMVDGRSIYDPLFSGTIWESKDVFMENIERVEVIRGPGGSTWGANAVNGVINIITKNAKDTQGAMVVAGGGTEERAFTDARYGAKLSEQNFVRFNGKFYQRDEGYLPEGSQDDAHHGNGGFRFDRNLDKENLSFEGLYDDGSNDGVDPANLDVDNRDLVFRGAWQKSYDDRSAALVNAYFARTDFDSPFIGEKRRTGELNAQYSFEAQTWLNIISGIQYRLTDDKIRNSTVIGVEPEQRTDNLLSAFTQGQIELIPDSLEARLGARIEHNDYSSFEFQPEFVLSWTPTTDEMVWGSVSRAVRPPSRLEYDFFIVNPTDGQTFLGNRDLQSENLLAYEVGYRRKLTSNVVLDLATFYNTYDDLIIIENNSLSNNSKGDTYGIELSSTWEASRQWKVTTGYSFLIMDLELDNDSSANRASAVDRIEGNNPEHQAFVRNSWDLRAGWQMDFDLRYVDSLHVPHVSHYFVGDARLAWHATKELELAVVGQNLFRAHHFEQGGTNASEVQQGVYGQVAWNY